MGGEGERRQWVRDEKREELKDKRTQREGVTGTGRERGWVEEEEEEEEEDVQRWEGSRC